MRSSGISCLSVIMGALYWGTAHERNNHHNKYAVAVVAPESAGHLTGEILKVCSLFLLRGGVISGVVMR